MALFWFVILPAYVAHYWEPSIVNYVPLPSLVIISSVPGFQVLVCAPSNGAVDELTQRLALESGGVWDQRGKAFSPRVVRVGNPSDGAMDRVRAVTLDVMVEER